MTKRRKCLCCFLLGLFVLLTFDPILPAQAQKTKADLAMVRKARDLIDAREYEKAYKILKPMEQFTAFDPIERQIVALAAKHRMADLIMRKDEANPYYDLVSGCKHLKIAAEWDEAPRAKWAFAEMLKLSPYLQQMPELMAHETFKWYLGAAELGYAPAQQAVGEMLATGRGPKTDYMQAYMWLTLAHNRYTQPPIHSKQDTLRAETVLSICNAMLEKKQITARQAKKALKMARKWEKKHPDVYKVWPVDEQDY